MYARCVWFSVLEQGLVFCIAFGKCHFCDALPFCTLPLRVMFTSSSEVQCSKREVTVDEKFAEGA
jgi:hypothetical protein